MNVYGQLIRAQLENLASAPPSGIAGRLFFDTVQKKVFFDDGSAIRAVGSGSGGGINYISNPDAEGSTTGYVVYNNTFVVTMTIASPGVVTKVAHGLQTDDPIVLTTTGALPTGLTATTTYYVKKIDADTFKLAATRGGADINTSGSQSGVHTLHPLKPLTGTGGTPVTTFTRSTSSPLRGAASFLITKDAAIRAGEGVSYDFTTAAADKGQVMRLSFDVLGDANFTSTDLGIWVYDVTNAVLIPVSPGIVMVGGSPFLAEFQLPTNSTSFRLCLHNSGGANGNAYTVKLDNIQLGPSPKVQGTPITDWQPYTLAIVGSITSPTKGTTTADIATWRRVGDSVQLRWHYVQTAAGSAGSGDYLIPLPAGMTIDLTKVASGAGSSGDRVGDAVVSGVSGLHGGGVYVYDATHLVFHGDNPAGTWGSGDNAFSSTNLEVSFNALDIPILGWSSNLQMSSDADTRVVVATIGGTPNSATAGNPIIFPTVAKDTHAGYNASTGQYTVKVSKFYEIKFFIQSGSNGSPIYLYRNGAQGEPIGLIIAGNGDGVGAATVWAYAGEVLDIRSTTNIVSPGDSTLSFTGVTGPSQIAASETVAAKYAIAGGGVTSDTSTPVNFATKIIDTHGAVTTGTWKFTAPSSGLYEIAATLAATAGGPFDVLVYKNGSSDNTILMDINSTDYRSGSTLVQLLAGEYIDLRASASITVPTETRLSVSIKRIGL